MSDVNLSVSAFKEFLEALPTLDLVKDATARNLKNSTARLLTVVRDNEMADVSLLDVEELAERYMNETSPTPNGNSITSYKSRMDSAVKKFIAYQKGDSIPYRQHSKSTLDLGEDSIGTGQEELPVMRDDKAVNETATEAPVKGTFTIPILVRPQSGVVVTIAGVPDDLTREEADRISSVLKIYTQKT
ncbi:hypothetical protein PZBJ_05730 [Pantoea endophytica]|uniref:Uncharacterized protein n=1 Tax=Pantoea endophytica TaxID=92488 RepID=A0ABX4SVA5_9GAMM|nr:hypothetical protein [Pantoea endophytica]PLR26289.1 hypothetical protein PZBJ_05730 [Pantoea endophytica]